MKMARSNHKLSSVDSGQQYQQGRAQEFSSRYQDQGPKIEAETGVEFLGRGRKHLPHQLGGLGERCELPSGVRDGETQPPKGFLLFSALKMASPQSPDTIMLLLWTFVQPLDGQDPGATPSVRP